MIAYSTTTLASSITTTKSVARITEDVMADVTSSDRPFGSLPFATTIEAMASA